MTDLGRSLSRHPGTFMAGGWLWYISGLLIVAAALGAGRALLMLLGLAAMDPNNSPISALLTAALGGFIGLLCAIVPVLRWRQSLEIFEGGLVWTRLIGDKTWPRSQLKKVRHVTHHSRQGTSYEVEITLTDGSIHGIVGLDQSQQAANLVHQVIGLPAPATTGALPMGTGWRPPGAA